jgi:hypothetical protein
MPRPRTVASHIDEGLGARQNGGANGLEVGHDAVPVGIYAVSEVSDELEVAVPSHLMIASTPSSMLSDPELIR